jgi:hypothetical protein
VTLDPNRENPAGQAPDTWSTPAQPSPAAASTNVPVQPVQPVRPVPVARKRGALDYALVVAVLVAIGGVAFAVGRTTAPAQAASVPNAGGFGPTGSFDPGFNPPAGGPGQGGGGLFGGGLTIEGTVSSVDGSALVIESADGQELTVTLDGDTTYHDAISADPSSVAAGDAVTVRVSGAGRFGGGLPGGGQAPEASGSPSLTATDVTVER